MSASSGPEDSNSLQEAQAFNTSILFMVAVPYLTLGGLGVVVYRSLRARIHPVFVGPIP